MKGYQLKLDFGEGKECHRLYEEFLQETGIEDTAEQWGMFVTCYQVIESMKVMEESKRHTLQ
jgi:hypothetical protein